VCRKVKLVKVVMKEGQEKADVSGMLRKEAKEEKKSETLREKKGGEKVNQTYEWRA